MGYEKHKVIGHPKSMKDIFIVAEVVTIRVCSYKQSILLKSFKEPIKKVR